MATPDYVVDKEVTIRKDFNDEPIIIPQYSFVRPIDYTWIPKHIKNDPAWRFHLIETYTFCYTKYGILPIETILIRKV